MPQSNACLLKSVQEFTRCQRGMMVQTSSWPILQYSTAHLAEHGLKRRLISSNQPIDFKPQESSTISQEAAVLTMCPSS